MERLCGTAECEEEPITADKEACLNEIANGNSRHRIGNGDGRRAADGQLQCAGRLNANSSRGRSNDVLNIDECGGWTGVSMSATRVWVEPPASVLNAALAL